MADVTTVVGFVALIALPVLIILGGMRRCRAYRLEQEQRPLEDQIADIRADAAFMVQQLQVVLERRPPRQPAATNWIPDMIIYYQRLLALAAAPDPSPDEIERLAKDSLEYVRERHLKGIFVADQAERLAVLVRRRKEV